MISVRILGSGTSHGIPVIGCSCPVCVSDDPRDRRTRSSVLVSDEYSTLLIDTATEFRLQAIEAGIHSISTICYTHDHADHLHGLDDIRVLTRERPVEIFASGKVIRTIRSRFSYAFNKHSEGGGVPRFTTHKISSHIPFAAGSFSVLPLEVMHGSLRISGYRIHDFAYITDCSCIPKKTLEMLFNLKLLVIGALRERRHPTHFSFSEVLALVNRIEPERTLITHLCHEHSHNDILKYFAAKSDKKIEPAYDGLLCTLE